MARAEKLFNVSSGLLVLPDGAKVLPGEGFDVTKDLSANSGVQSWIKDRLVASDAPREVATPDTSALQADVVKLTAELADANDQIAKLTADLAAATKPKG